MKGVINRGLQDFVEDRFGSEAWEKIKSLARCEEPFFSISEDYPDSMTTDLVAAAAEVAGLSADTVLFELGKAFVTHTLIPSYPTYVQLAGSSARGFLLNLDKVHKMVTRNMPNAAPPSFLYDELPDGRLLMHYRSKRALCAALRGLILSVGAHFGQDLQVRETACMKNGDAQCTMEITFP